MGNSIIKRCAKNNSFNVCFCHICINVQCSAPVFQVILQLISEKNHLVQDKVAHVGTEKNLTKMYECPPLFDIKNQLLYHISSTYSYTVHQTMQERNSVPFTFTCLTVISKTFQALEI